MSVVDKATLKSYFETGDFPTESQFADLIDSLYGLEDAPIAAYRAFGEYVNQATTGTSAEQLSSTYTLPADTLDTNGQVLRVAAWGDIAANANVKSVFLSLGATPFGCTWNTGLTTVLKWKMVATVLRYGSANQSILIEVSWGNATATSNTFQTSVNNTVGTKDLTSDLDVAILGQTPGSAGDLTLAGWNVEILR